MRPTILLLREGTDESQVRSSRVFVCAASAATAHRISFHRGALSQQTRGHVWATARPPARPPAFHSIPFFPSFSLSLSLSFSLPAGQGAVDL
jgi:hypothetical protein